MTHYTVYSASGNPTALVWAFSQSEEKRKEINEEIMAQNSMVEQVGFLLPNACGITYPGVGGTTISGIFSLKMAGGEFCGNAARCAIYAYLRGEEGIIDLSVSGAERPVRGGLRTLKDGSKEVWCSIPVPAQAAECLLPVDEGWIVRLGGIVHLVIEGGTQPGIDTNSPEEKKAFAFELLKKYGLNREPAAGVIWITGRKGETREQAQLSILPVVYVREINTLFCETACGTGTVAAALVYSQKNKSSFRLSAVQPSGEALSVEVQYSSGTFLDVVLKGPVKELDSRVV